MISKPKESRLESKNNGGSLKQKSNKIDKLLAILIKEKTIINIRNKKQAKLEM